MKESSWKNWTYLLGELDMIHKFLSEIEKHEIDPLIIGFLKGLYKAEENGYSDPSQKPSITYYENHLKRVFEKNFDNTEEIA